MSTDLEALYGLEASVLGAVLLDNSSLQQFPQLEPDYFSHARWRLVFSAMRNLEAANRPIDVVTLQAELAAGGHTSVGYADLGELALHVPTVDNAIEYVRRIRDAWVGRRVRIALGDVLSKAGELSGVETLSLAFELLAGIDEDQPDETISIGKLVNERLRQLEQIAADRINGVQTLTGFPTGVSSLDEKIGGYQPEIVTIVCGRPGMGKSSLMLAGCDASSAAGYGVHLFNMEDTRASYADRAMSRASQVPAVAMRNSTLERGQLVQISRGLASLHRRTWLTDSRSGLTADEIVRSVRRHRKANGTRVVFIDYLQLVRHAQRKGIRMQRHEQLDEMMAVFAAAAKVDRMAYVVGSQLNRKLEERTDKRPMMADLRESGGIEEKSKCIIGCYRGSEYGAPIKGIDWHPDWKGHSVAPTQEEHSRTMQCIVIKMNNGATGSVFAEWNGPCTSVS